ncbi:MAG: phosphoesterase [Planctomycetes bacterium]|nr:phosphoesterase [Planctomycetota bacterium]
MRIQLLSDLHIEDSNFDYESCNPDVVAFAGDIHTKTKGVKWIIESIPRSIPVIYVLGNHEFWGRAYPKFITEMKAIAKGTNVHILVNEMISVSGVNFFGATLWTDYEISGDARLSGYECQSLMRDYKKIRRTPSYSKLRSIDTAVIHARSVTWLKQELLKKHGANNVVITHHAPSIKSIKPRNRREKTVPAYASNLEALIAETRPSHWLHGHLHNSSDYWLGGCRVLCNPRGYSGRINPEFDPFFSFEV